MPPEIAFLKPPAPARSGALALTYSLKDDYGVVGRAAPRSRPSMTPRDGAEARPLFEAPQVAAVAAAAPHPRRRVARRSATSPPTRGPAPR